MYLVYDKNSKDPIYYIQTGIRLNKTKTTTRTIERVGKHSELLLEHADPLAYAIERVNTLKKQLNESTLTVETEIDFNKPLPPNHNNVPSDYVINVGCLYIRSVYKMLGLDSFFKKITGGSKIKYDPSNSWLFTITNQIMNPASKLSMSNKTDKYIGFENVEYQHILRTMDLINKHYDKYIEHLYINSQKITPRDTSVFYYDCTNYYYEIEYPDDDYQDPITGEIIKGYRKYGVSKEHRPNPIVEMGLIIDKSGLPVTMCLHPGNSNEQTTAIPLENTVIKLTKNKPFVYCADGGLGSYNIRKFNSMHGRHFVVTQSIKKMKQQFQEAVFNDFDYRLLSNNKGISINDLKSMDPKKMDLDEYKKYYTDFAYKEFPAYHSEDLGLYDDKSVKKGKTKDKLVLEQKVIVLFSLKSMAYQREIRNRQIERAKAKLKNLDPTTYKKGQNDFTRFIKRVNGVDKKNDFVIDEDLIRKEEKYDGFTAIATNYNVSINEILEIQKTRFRIEESFRILKTEFKARPAYHFTHDRIKAHFTECFTALLVFRLLEKELIEYGVKTFSTKDSKWHATVQEIIETLNRINVTKTNGYYYQATYSDSKILKCLSDRFGIDLRKQYYMEKNLRNLIKQKN